MSPQADQYGKVVTPESEITRTCIKCGHVTQAFASFCPQCGGKIAQTGSKPWYRSHAIKILTFLFLTPMWTLIVLFDPDERTSVKVFASIICMAYIAWITLMLTQGAS